MDDHKSKDALVKQLKSCITEIKTQLNEFHFDIGNGMSRVKEHCDNLRNDIKYTTLCTIQMVKKTSETLLHQIDDYEQSCIYSYESKLEDKKIEHSSLLKEMTDFNSKWDHYLKQIDLDYNQLAVANKVAYELKKKAVSEKKRHYANLFNQKVIKYEKNAQPITMILGSLKFENIDKKFKTLNIKHYISDFNRTNSNSLVYDQLEDKSFYILYQANNDHLKSFIVDPEGQLLAEYVDNHSIIQFKKHKDAIIIQYRDSRGYYYLKSLNLKLKDMHSLSFYHGLGSSFDHPCSILSVNDNNIYLLQAFCNQVRIFNRKLKYLKSVGQINNPSKPFYFPKNIIQLECNYERFFWLNSLNLNILHEQTGILVNSLSVYADKFMFDTKENIYVLDKSVTKLACYTINGIALRTIEILDFNIGNFIFLDKNDNVVIVK